MKNIPIFLLVVICLLGIGYASVNVISLDVSGTLGALSHKNVYITNVVDEHGNEINGFYSGTLLKSTIELDSNDLESSKTYIITVYNNTNNKYKYSSIICDQTDSMFYSNTDIEYNISEISEDEKIEPNSSKTFKITFKYKENLTEIINNTLTSNIRFVFENSTSDFDLSGIGNGEAFSLGEIEYTANSETIYVEMDVTSLASNAINENLITIGEYISNWEIPSSLPGAVNLHIYYPSDDGKIIIAPLIQGERAIQLKKAFTITGSSRIIKIAFNSNGLYINGNEVIDSSGAGAGVYAFSKQNAKTVEEYLDIFFNRWKSGKLTVEIGSEEGVNRSNAKYNSVEIYKQQMTDEEMSELTQIRREQTLEDIRFTEFLDNPYLPAGAKFAFDTGDLCNDLSLQTIYSEIDITNMSTTSSKENIISIGHDIPEWTPTISNGANIHLFYPDDDGSLILAVTLNGSSAGIRQWRIAMSSLDINNGKLKIAVNFNAIYINGIKLISYAEGYANPNLIEFSAYSSLNRSTFIRETFSRLGAEGKTISVGSKQGDNRSTVQYDKFRIYDNIMSEEDMAILTTP